MTVLGRRWPAWGLIVGGAALSMAGLWAALAVARHAALQTNAFDLGYVTQALWYTVHGQPYRFTTVSGLPFSPEGDFNVAALRQPPSLLAFHVEALLLLLAPIFALWPDPRWLLILQAGGLAAGALPVAALAHRRLGRADAAVVFGTAFLLSPSIAAASQADFHAVAIGTSLLAATLYCLAAGQRRAALVFAGLTAAAREDAAIMVAALGAYLWLRAWRAGHRPAGSAADPFDAYGAEGRWLCLGAGALVLLIFLGIEPYFNGTLSAWRHGQTGVGSIFWHRYAWLGATPLLALRNLVLAPGRWLGWFDQPDVLAYLATLALSGGALALLAPEVLLVALPLVLQNALSSFDWMRSGGAHYSTIGIPILLWAGIEGARRALDPCWWGRWSALGRRIRQLRLPLLVVLLAAAANHYWLGASPLVPGLIWPAPDARDAAVAAALAQIPPSASVSATSTLYPHLASRAQAYWFPAVNGATYVAIDAVSGSDPLGPAELKGTVDHLLATGAYGVVASAPGFLLLRRGAGDDAIPSSFDAFARAPAHAAPPAGPPVQFADGLRLLGSTVVATPTITIFGPSATVTTYWQATHPLGENLRFVFYPTRRPDGAIVGALADQAPEPIWYGTSRWRPGETIALHLTVARVRDLQALGVAVVDPTTGQPVPVQAGPGVIDWEGGTIARVTGFDGG